MSAHTLPVRDFQSTTPVTIVLVKKSEVFVFRNSTYSLQYTANNPVLMNEISTLYARNHQPSLILFPWALSLAIADHIEDLKALVSVPHSKGRNRLYSILGDLRAERFSGVLSRFSPGFDYAIFVRSSLPRYYLFRNLHFYYLSVNDTLLITPTYTELWHCALKAIYLLYQNLRMLALSRSSKSSTREGSENNISRASRAPGTVGLQFSSS